MSEKNNNYKIWKEVIVDFFEHKVQSCLLFKAREYIEKKEKEIETEKDERKLQRAVEAKEKKQKEYELLKKDAPSTEIREWLDETRKKNIAVGKRIIKATHVLKFTHSSSDSEGILLTEKANDYLLSTASIKKNLTIDLAHNNGNLITISRFLALYLGGKQIIDLIINNDFCFLEPFAGDESQLKNWQEGFTEIIEQRDIKSADKAKQIYFPITSSGSIEDRDYHIVVPLFPSSLSHESYSIVTALKYGDEQRDINKTRKEQFPKYRKVISKEIPSMSTLLFGGEHPKNVSMLNAERSGKTFLFSTQPPSWISRLKPPVAKFSFFNKDLTYRVKETVEYLRTFLLRFQTIDLSIRNPKKKKWIAGWINQIMDEVMNYAALIQNIPPGWSRTKGIRLKLTHQYFLDPYRDDEEFQKARQTTDWQEDICRDFASWLNGRLKGKDKKFTPKLVHTRMWEKYMKQALIEHTQYIDWVIKHKEKQA